jgi:hypothetical protein
VGPDGIEYAGSGDEQEIIGPALLAGDPVGGLHFYDPVGRRLLSYTGDARVEIDTAALDIASVTALAANSDHLIAVEIFFQPVRNRVHRIGFDGAVIETIELPVGFRLEDGLSGVLTGDAGQIILEFSGGALYGIWNGADAGFKKRDVLDIDGLVVEPQPPDLMVGGVLLAADLTMGLGGLRLLGIDPAGNIVVERQDVTTMDPVLRVTTSVEWYSPGGALLGAARVPTLQEQFISTAPPVALLPDGTAVALLALEDEVRIDRLARQPDRIAE